MSALVCAHASVSSPPDQHEFQQLLKTFSLCALNCWRRAGTQAQTFLPATGHRGTRIDFVLTRTASSGWSSPHLCSYLAPLCRGLWRATLTSPRVHPYAQSAETESEHLSADLLASVRQTLRTHPDLAPAYTMKAAQLLKDSTPDTISSKLHAAWLQCNRIQRILTEAEQAAHKGLTAVYQVVRKLAPKSTRKPILFRDLAVSPLSTEQEVKSLKDYFRNLYGSDHPEAAPPGNSFPSFTKGGTARCPATPTTRQSTSILGCALTALGPCSGPYC